MSWYLLLIGSIWWFWPWAFYFPRAYRAARGRNRGCLCSWRRKYDLPSRCPKLELTLIGTFAFYIKARRSASPLADMLNGLTGSGTHILSARTQLFSPSGSSLKAITPDHSLPSTPSRIRHNYHILLVEDNLINQKVLSKQLRSAGCTVHVANHGLECLDFLAKTNLWNDNKGDGMELSLILMDLEMPIMDGLAATRRIRDLEREGKVECHVPIIAVTANTRLEQMDTALEAGMVRSLS
jgi:CheY-like chemotaxis protein